MMPSFRTADRQTYRRVVIVGALFCLAFAVISFSLRPQTAEVQVLITADRLKQIAGEAPLANRPG